MKVGNAIATIATPIARALHLPCIDPETRQLRPESRCNKARLALNEGRFADAFYDRFWPVNQQTNGGNQMQFIITIAVEAESVEEALQKKAEGKTMSVQPRPQPAQRPATPVPQQVIPKQ